MASLYPKPKSPYWYLQYRDPVSGKLVNRSTGLLRADPNETREARKLRAQWEAKELSTPRLQSGEAWAAWVPDFLLAKYAGRGSAELPSIQRANLTYTRAKNAWAALAKFLETRNIRAPRLLTRKDCIDYFHWRTGPAAAAREEGLRAAKHNTALLEVKFLSAVMKEAVMRGFATANPCLQLGVKRGQTKVKPAITDEEIAVIEEALLADDETRRPYNEAMRTSWQIALLQVCRLSETCIILDDVSLGEGTITFKIKGGRDHTAMLHPDLIPLFTALKKQGRKRAFDMPSGFSRKWQDFFHRHGLDHLTFHSTRVTGVTRLRRAGVDVRVAMDYVGHSSVLVHRVYQRNKRDEQLSAVQALSRTPSSENPDSSSARKAHG